MRGTSWLSYLPVTMCLRTSVHPFHANSIRRQCVHVRCADRALSGDLQEGGKYAFHAFRLKLAFSKMSYCTFNVHDCQYCLEIVYIPLVGHDLWPLTFYRERCCTGCDGGTIHRTMTPGSLRHTWMTAGRCCLCTRRSWLRWSQRRKLAWWDCLDVCSHNCVFSKSLIYRY